MKQLDLAGAVARGQEASTFLLQDRPERTIKNVAVFVPCTGIQQNWWVLNPKWMTISLEVQRILREAKPAIPVRDLEDSPQRVVAHRLQKWLAWSKPNDWRRSTFRRSSSGQMFRWSTSASRRQSGIRGRRWDLEDLEKRRTLRHRDETGWTSRR